MHLLIAETWVTQRTFDRGHNGRGRIEKCTVLSTDLRGAGWRLGEYCSMLICLQYKFDPFKCTRVLTVMSAQA
jgi:hypothetical protein